MNAHEIIGQQTVRIYMLEAEIQRLQQENASYRQALQATPTPPSDVPPAQ